MKKIVLISTALLFFCRLSTAQQTDDQIRVKIDAFVDGNHVVIDTSISSLGDFDISSILEELGVHNELQQLNIDINSGMNYNFHFDQQAIEKMMEGLDQIEIPAIPSIPELPDVEGMEIFTSNKALLGVYTDKVPEGAKISEVIEGSGAEEAGLKEGDIITMIDSRTIESPSNLSEVIAMYDPNTVVRVTYLRDGKTETVSGTLKENDSYDDWSLQLQSLDSMQMRIDSFNMVFDKAEWEKMMKADQRGFLGVYLEDEKNGVTVSGIIEKSAAEEAGLQEGDILRAINGKTVATYDDVVTILDDTKPGDKVSITYERDGKQMKTDAVLKESQNTYFFWNEDGNEEGTAPDIMIHPVTPCLPGSVYSYSSTDGNKKVNVCITLVTAPDAKENKRSDEGSSNTQRHPLLNPDNLVIYSNPSTGSFNVKFNLPDEGDVKIIITDINGSEVYHENIDNFSGAYDKTISLGDTAKGTYFVKVTQNGYSSTKTVVLQ